MEYIQEFFSCDACECKDFLRVSNFGLRFHGINFSDDLIYDSLVNEIYQCTVCGKRFTMDQIEERLTQIKKKYRHETSE